MFTLSHTLALFVQHERMWVKLDCVGRGHRHANNQIINLLENSAAGESKHIDLMSPIGWRATRLSVCHQNDSIVDSMTREAMLLCQHICEANARSRKKKNSDIVIWFATENGEMCARTRQRFRQRNGDRRNQVFSDWLLCAECVNLMFICI